MKKFLWGVMIYWCHITIQAQPLLFTEVVDGLFVFEGKIADVFDEKKGMVANVTFIIGSTSVAIIDTGSSYRQGLLIKQAIRQQTNLPIKYIINSHVHLDHIFGNQAFVIDKPQFISHHKYPAQLNAKGSYYLNRLNAPWYAGTQIIQPTRLIHQKTIINLGNRELVLMPLINAHTDHDLMVFDQKSATLIAGDIIFVNHCPVLYGSLIGWINLIFQLQKIHISQIVPGHGPVSTKKMALMKIKHYLITLRAAVTTAIKNQINLATASKTLLLDHAQDWQLFDEFHQRNIITAYTELEWE